MASDKYYVRPFALSHLSSMKPIEWFVPKTTWGYMRSVAFTGFYDTTVVACVGLFVEARIAHAWAVVDQTASAHALFIHRTTVRYLEALIEVLGLWRVQAFVLSTFARARTWVERLGFAYEGLMRRAAPNGEDFALYARVTNG